MRLWKVAELLRRDFDTRQIGIDAARRLTLS
jgi:hypothetical protein